MATTYSVDLKFAAQTQALDTSVAKLNNVETAAKKLQGTINQTKLDALTGAIDRLPGGAGVAANGIINLSNKVKDLREQSKAAAAEMTALSTAIKVQEAAIGNKRIQLGAKGGIGGEALKREIAGMQSDLAGMNAAMATAGRGGGVMAGGLALAAGATVALVAALGAAAVPMVRFTNEVDRSRQQLTLFTKDVKVTNQIIASLQNTADATSLGLPGLLEATKTMSAYGIEAQNAAAATKMLGDLALGDNEKLQRFAVNFAQIASLGRAYTVDLKQFGMAGIPIFDALSKVTGKSTAEIMKMAEEGKVTYPLIVKALQELTKEGASFYQGAERGGTDLDRALNQLTGSWERLSQIVGSALSPAVVGAIKAITEVLDGLNVTLQKVGEAAKAAADGPAGKFASAWLNALGKIASFIKENPALAALIPGGNGLFIPLSLQKIGGEADKSKSGNDAKERAKLAADAEAKARRDAEDSLQKLREGQAEKIAAIELNKARQLEDARRGFERDMADFRISQLERIADMERQMMDDRRQAEFKLAQSQADIASGQRVAGLSSQILQDRAAGRDTTALEAARGAEELMNRSARQRAQIQFDSASRTVELERRLTDFKRETQRQLGQMQLAYSRQTEDILRNAATSVSDEMVKGAKAAKEILESVNMPMSGSGGGGAGDTYVQPGVGTFSRSTGRLVAAAGGAGGKIVEHLHGDPGRPGYDPRGHGTQANAHDHFAFDSEATTKKVMEGLKKLGYTITEFGVKSGHATNSLHYSNRAFDVPWSQFGSGPIGQNDFNRSRQLRKDVDRLLGSSAPAVAANNIVPTARPQLAQAGIPTTSPGLEAANKSLKDLEAAQKKNELLLQEQQLTQELADKLQNVLETRDSTLKSMRDQNMIEQQTLALMQSGVAPELAKQLATNQQLVDSSTRQLEGQRIALEAAVKEKDITAETRAERQKLLDLINQQIGAQGQMLGSLNAEATQTQALADQRAAADQAKSDAQGIAGSITGGMKEAIKAAITGGDVKAALSNMLGNIGDRLLDIAFRPLEDMLTKGLTQMFSPQKVATDANTFALVRLTAVMEAQAFSSVAGGFNPLGIAGSIFGIAGAGFGGGAFGAGFNPLSTTKLVPGGIFEGGGYTGDAPRAGGVDGKGGFPAILHPGETVTDHRASSARSALSSGKGGGEGINVTYSGPQLNFNGDEYLPKSAVNDIINSASRRGAAMGTQQTLDRLRQSPSTRRRVGL